MVPLPTHLSHSIPFLLAQQWQDATLRKEPIQLFGPPLSLPASDFTHRSLCTPQSKLVMSYDDEYRNAFADSTSASDDPFAANPFADMQSSSIAVVPSPRTPGNDAADQATPVYETANAFQPTDFTSPPTPSTAFPTPVLERHHPGVTPFEPLPTVDNAPDDLASPFASTLSIDGHVEAAPKQALDMSALLGDLDQPTTFAKPATKEAGMPSLGRKPVGGALASLLGVEPDARELEREKERRRIQSELLAQKKLASATKASTQAQQTPLPSSRPESVMSDHASSSDSHSYSQPPQHAQQVAPHPSFAQQ